jgi:hypothetical protein
VSTKQITAGAMALPLAEKVSLAQALWQSIDAGLPDAYEQEMKRGQARLARELPTGKATGFSRPVTIRTTRRAMVGR